MDHIGHYKIIKKIGEGGMGEVYKGVDAMLEREVAIKLMRPELSNRPEIVERFRSEAIALGRLNHSNIAAVYNFGQTENQYYMALEFVSGDTLDSTIKKYGKLPWREALNYAIAALDGLEHAHQLKIIHRDIKPANIMINEQGSVKIMDFGIARILGKERMTQMGRFIGTLEYMPPEQIQGKEADARSDVYAMGAVLYEMLTGHILFERDTEFELLNSQISEKPKSLREFNQEVSPELEKIILRALEKEPEKRYTSAREFSQVLRRLVLAEPTTSLTHQAPLIAFCKNYPAVATAVLLLLPAGSYVVWQLNSVSHSQAPELVVPPKVEQLVESIDEIISENQSIELDRSSEIASTRIPGIQNSMRHFPPNLPSFGETEDPVEENPFDVKSETVHMPPIPERKPAVPEYFAQTDGQSATRTSTPAQRNTVTKTISSSPVRDQPADDPGIDKWAKDFFGN